MKQIEFFKINWAHRFCHGGILRNKRAGRKFRPLSKKDPHHLVLKSNFKTLRNPVTHTLILKLTRKYAKRFFIRIEQISIQHDHVHLLFRASKRSMIQSFLRVLSGQIAQTVTHTYKKAKSGPRFWRYRPFTRVIKGWKPYLRVKEYIQLNEKEARGEIKYRKNRLKGMTLEGWCAGAKSESKSLKI